MLTVNRIVKQHDVKFYTNEGLDLAAIQYHSCCTNCNFQVFLDDIENIVQHGMIICQSH